MATTPTPSILPFSSTPQFGASNPFSWQNLTKYNNYQAPGSFAAATGQNPTTPAPAPSNQGSQSSNQSRPTPSVNPNDANSIKNAFPGYAGWNDPNAIIGDFKATGGQGKGGSTSSSNNGPQAPDLSVFDQIINPVISNFEQLIGTQQDTSAHNIANLGTQRQTELDTENSQFAGQQAGLNTQAQAQTDAANNAIEEAKRMYAEMSQGTLARYGTTTGTGAFLTEQLGQSTGRNIALLRQGLQQSLQDINDKKTQVQQMGELAVRGTNERFDQAIQTEQDNLQKAIVQIKGNEAMLQSNKAQMAAQAIQHYQDTVNNLNAQRAQQQQQWAIATLNAQTQLQIYGQKGAALLQSTTNPNYLNLGVQGLTNPTDTTVTPPTTTQDTGSQPISQNNAFQTAIGMNNQIQNPIA